MKLRRASRVACLAACGLLVANAAAAAEGASNPPSAAFPEEPAASSSAGASGATKAPIAPQAPPPVTEPPAVRNAEAHPATAPVVQAPVAATPSADAASDSDAVFRAFDTFAGQMKLQRMAVAVGGMALGAGTMVVGGILANETNTSPDPWYLIGGVAIGASAIGLFMPSRAEALALQYRAAAPGHSAGQAAVLESAWQNLARNARQQRYIGSVISLVLGAGAITAGALILSGTGDFSQDDRTAWGSILLGGGIGVAIGGTTQLFLPTPTEASFAQYAATRPNAATLQLSLGGPGGLGFSAKGTF